MISESKKRIVLLVDESGSMSSQRFEVISGINDMIRQQRELQDEPIEFTVVKFNTIVENVSSGLLDNIDYFTSVDYIPRGGTALYDAIGSTINKYIDETNNIMIIVTDGQENSSREFSRTQMVSLIDNQQQTKNWNFIYLSEDPTTVKQGVSMGITNSKIGCSNTCVGQRKSGKAIGEESLQMYINDVSKDNTSMNYDDWKSANYKQTTTTTTKYAPLSRVRTTTTTKTKRPLHQGTSQYSRISQYPHVHGQPVSKSWCSSSYFNQRKF